MRAKHTFLLALVAGLLLPPSAAATENFADEPPFGGTKPPPLTRPPSPNRPPPGFRLSAREATRIAATASAVVDERAQSGPLRAVPYERGPDEWQVDFFAGPGAGTKVAEAIVVDGTGAVLGAWHDQQLGAELARGYDGAIAQKVNAPYVWLLLSVLFIAPFLDPRRLLRIVHLDLLVLLGLGVSLFFFNRGEITASVGLTYPVLGYFLVRMLAAGLWPREREGPLVPLVPIRWLAGAAIALALGRVALNIVDSHVIDIGVAGVIGADHITHGQSLYNGTFSPGIDLRGDVYGPFNYLAYAPFELIWPWHGTWGSVPAAHAAAIAFDLLTALGLVALGRRLRAGDDGRALGIAMAFAWLACPFTLYAMNANANDGLVAALMVGAMLALRSPPARGVMVALAAAAKFGPAALAPLFAFGTGERRLRSSLLFGAAFAIVLAALFLPFVPGGGLSEVYDRTLGYQAARSSPFSVWGLAPSLDFLRVAVRAAAVALAVGVAFYPRRRSAVDVAALAAAVTIAVQLGATHWFYFYVVWFLPFVLVASFASQRTASPASGQDGPQLPELRRADHDLVARTKPDVRVSREPHPGRRSRRDQVAGLQRHQAREVGDQGGNREDQVVGRRGLHLLAVQRQRERDRVVRPGLVGRHERRPAGRRAVEDLAGHPLRGRALEVAGGEVVQQRVAGDVVQGGGLGDILRPAPDHERHLGLVVDLVAGRRQRHGRAGSGEGVAELGEEGRPRWRLHSGLRRVGAVVEADADDLLRVGNRRQKLNGLALDGSRLPVDRRGQLAQALLGEQLAEALAAATKRVPGVDDAPIGEDAGAVATVGSVGDQPHRGRSLSLPRISPASPPGLDPIRGRSSVG